MTGRHTGPKAMPALDPTWLGPGHSLAAKVRPGPFLVITTSSRIRRRSAGVSFRHALQPDIPRNRWICAEFMVKHNTPGLPDGGQAFWIDGELRGHWAGIDWRKTAGLQANALTVETYVTERRPQPESVAAASLLRVARYRSERSYLLPLTVVEQWQHDMVQTAKLQTDDLAVKGAKALDSDRMALADLTTHHRLVHGDSRDMSLVADESVHLAQKLSNSIRSGRKGLRYPAKAFAESR